jgi:hypothetical protein
MRVALIVLQETLVLEDVLLDEVDTGIHFGAGDA